MEKTRDSANKKKSGHVPSLDGLRAISIILVLLGHVGGTDGFDEVDLGIGDYAHLGVVVFFVISGFLITSLLISEEAKKGQVSLKLFYARRALRIFPASYAYIGFLVVLSLAGVTHLRIQDFWHAVTYTVNYTRSQWDIGHLWSLSVEEQFYLLWPLVFVTAGPRRVKWAIGVILFAPIARIFARIFLQHAPYGGGAMFPMIADGLAAGCLLALIRTTLESWSWYLKLFQPVYSFGLLALILLTNHYLYYTPMTIFGTSVINISLAILIHRSVYRYDDWMGKILNLRALALIGGLSYSLYLWQQPFLNRNSDAWMNAFPQNIILAVGAALASYTLLERPFLKLRSYLRVH
jgi:peptidoglycan/LPS O-acetylase OafA/YrhL